MAANVRILLSDLGPVIYDATADALMFDLGDTGIVADSFESLGAELKQKWGRMAVLKGGDDAETQAGTSRRK